MDLYKLQAIAQDYRPNINISDIKCKSLSELKDFLACAIFKKKEEDDRITEIFSTNIAAVVTHKQHIKIMEDVDKWYKNED